MFDNRLFNVNGRGEDMLALTLRIAALQHGIVAKPYAGWKVHPKKGLILYWHAEDKVNAFLTGLNADEVSKDVNAWLQIVKPEQFEALQWEDNCDHDGSNSVGWRVYCEDWGHVDGDSYAIVAVKPVYLWHGK